MKDEDCPAYPIDEETTDRFMEGVHIETGETKFDRSRS